VKIDTIHNINCLGGLRALPDDVIDLTVTSPPYDNLRSYNNTAVWDYNFFCKLAHELFRVTKPGGVVIWIVGDATVKGSETGSSFRQALYFMNCGFRLHDTMIYHKNGFSYPEINRYYPAFEYMFVFSKGKPKTAMLITDRQNKCGGQPIHSTERKPDGSLLLMTSAKDGSNRKIKPIGVRSNVWTYSAGKGLTTKDSFAFKHPAMFPERLAEDHILTWSEQGDLVLDPFLGSGTTAKMAILNGRHYLGYETNPDYYNIAVRRINEAKAGVIVNDG